MSALAPGGLVLFLLVLAFPTVVAVAVCTAIKLLDRKFEAADRDRAVRAKGRRRRRRA